MSDRDVTRLALPLLGVVVATAPARAGRLAPDDAEPIDSAPASVRVELDRATPTQALITARYTHRVHGPGLVSWDLDAPTDAAIVGATVEVDGATHRLALARTEEARTRREAVLEAPGPAPTRPRDRAWTATIAGGGRATVELDVPYATTATVELALVTPTCFHADTRYAIVPASFRAVLPADGRRSIDPAARAACLGDGNVHTDAGDVLVAFPDRTLASRESGAARIGTATARLPLATKHVARIEVDLAARLADVPADLATVFLVDASRSLTADELDVERRVIRSYLEHAPRTRVQVVAYARQPRSLLAGWSLASQVAPRVDRELRALALRNGSNVDLAIAAAATWLERAPGTRRVVLFTDERAADAQAALVPAALAARLPPNTIVHVVAMGPGARELERDATLFDGLAEVTGGIAVRGSVVDASVDEPARDRDPAERLHDAEQLVRPIALDHLALDAPGWERDGGTCNADGNTAFSLDEGQSCTWNLHGPAVAGPVRVEGDLWGTHVTRVIAPDPTRATALARAWLAITAETGADLEALQDAAHAVSERWALFARWGGRAGYADLPRGGMAMTATCSSTCGGSIGGGSHDVGIGTMARTPEHALALQLRNGVAACDVASHRIEVRLETTREEIVGLDVRMEPSLTGLDDAALAVKRACVIDALWDVPLSIPHAPAHAFTSLVL